MSDSGKTPEPKTPVAETARQEGAQGRTGASDTAGNGEVDASDPNMAAEIADVADEVHANA